MKTLAVVVALLVSSPALAQVEVAEPFGSPGQVALFGGLSVSFNRHGFGSGYRAQLTPTVDVFVLSNLSVGAEVAMSYSKSETLGSTSATMTRLGFAPRLGYQLSLGERFSLWPRAFLGWDHVESHPADLEGRHFGAELPFIFRPVPHFLIGFGPRYTHFTTLGPPAVVSNGADSIDFSLTLGGWF